MGDWMQKKAGGLCFRKNGLARPASQLQVLENPGVSEAGCSHRNRVRPQTVHLFVSRLPKEALIQSGASGLECKIVQLKAQAARNSKAIAKVCNAEMDDFTPPDAVSRFNQSFPKGLSRQQQRAAGRQWLADRLSDLAGQAVAVEDIGYSANGKPFVKGLDWAFSYANSQGLVALAAMAGEGAIGLDVEHFRAGKNHEKLAKRYFSHHEQAALQEKNGQDKQAAFYALWTAREARVKRDGGRLWHSIRQAVLDPETRTGRHASDARPLWIVSADPDSDCHRLFCLWADRPIDAVSIDDDSARDNGDNGDIGDNGDNGDDGHASVRPGQDAYRRWTWK